MSITLDGTAGVTTPAITGTTGTFSGALTANGLTGNLYPLVTGTVNAGGTNPFPVSGGPTSVDFTGIPSWAKRVTVMFNGVSTTGTSIIQLQIGTSSSVALSGYSGGYQQGTTTSALTTGIALCPFTSATTINIGSFRVENITGNTWVVTGINSVSTPSVSLSAGSITLSGVLDRVRITTVNGTDTFDAGSINIMWEG